MFLVAKSLYLIFVPVLCFVKHTVVLSVYFVFLSVFSQFYSAYLFSCWPCLLFLSVVIRHFGMDDVSVGKQRDSHLFHVAILIQLGHVFFLDISRFMTDSLLLSEAMAVSTDTLLGVTDKERGMGGQGGLNPGVIIPSP